MKRPATLVVAVLAAGALFAAGCGDDDDSTTTDSGATGASGAPLSETAFVDQANAICRAGSKELDQAAQALFGGQQPTDAQIEQYATETLVPSIQGQIDAIRALTLPEDISDQTTTFLDDSESALDEIEADPSLLAVSDDAGPFAESNAQAETLGLTECAG